MVEFPGKIDALGLYRKALEKNICIVPGRGELFEGFGDEIRFFFIAFDIQDEHTLAADQHALAVSRTIPGKGECEQFFRR